MSPQSKRPTLNQQVQDLSQQLAGISQAQQQHLQEVQALNQQLAGVSETQQKYQQEVHALSQDLATISQTHQKHLEEVDFKLYLDAVNTSSQRSRNILYVLIITIMAAACAFRQVEEPDWEDARFFRVREAYQFLTREPFSDELMTCDQFNRLPERESLNYAARLLNYAPSDPARHAADQGQQLVNDIRLHFKSSKTPVATSHSDDPQSQLQALRNEMDELRKVSLQTLYVSLPLLGIHIDSNDLALLASAAFSVVLYLLASSFRRERLNLRVARDRAKANPANMELLLMAQVLSPGIIPTTPEPPPAKKHDMRKWLPHIPIWATIVATAILVFVMIVLDFSDWRIARILEGSKLASIDYVLEGAFALLAFLFCVQALGKFNRLNNELRELENAAQDERNKKLQEAVSRQRNQNS